MRTMCIPADSVACSRVYPFGGGMMSLAVRVNAVRYLLACGVPDRFVGNVKVARARFELESW